MINSVLQGDCLELMKEIPDRSIDMILCDLPYGTTACKWDAIIPFEPLWEQYKRIVKPNAAIVLTASQPFTSQLVMSNPKWFRYEWIWEKTCSTGFLDANRKPLKSHENILVFSESRSNYNPQKIKSKPYKRPSGICSLYGKHDQTGTVNNGDRYPNTLIKIPNPNFESKHPTQKPVALFEYLIKTYTNEGDVILDNCAGSGTTAIAALNTNRNYILMEKESEYIEVINKRISGHTIQLSLAL